MNPREEFLKHAAECQQMAKSTRDPASKLTWNRMASGGIRVLRTTRANAKRWANNTRRRKGIAGI
jgi:hypothetical protein